MTSAARHPVGQETGTAEPSSTQRPATVRPTSWRERTTEVGRRLGAWKDTPGAFDTAVGLVYFGFAFWLLHGLWPHPGTRAIADNVNDQALNEWFLSHGVLFWTGDYSLVTDRLNVPEGVNLMSNASNVLYSILMAPVTALFGVAVTFTLMMTINLAATATGWYLLLARGLGLRRGAALVGGVFAGFAPGMISQSNSHIHMTAQWLVPPIVYCVIRLTRVHSARGVVGAGVGLAVLVSAQVLIGEEVLFLTALTLGIFAIVYVVRRPNWSRRIAPRFLAGVGLATALAGALLAYPLWVQFFGLQHTPNAPFEPRFFYADIATYFLFSPLSIGGSPDVSQLSTSSAEFNSYLGLPLIIMVVLLVAWRWRSPVVLAIAVTGGIMGYLSLGPHLALEGEQVGVPSLYGLINDMPVINSALPTRYALALIPLIGVLLAYSIDAAVRSGGFARVAVPLAIVAALLPNMPLPLVATSREPVPRFITSGAWRQCAPDGGVMVLVPAPSPREPDLMRWPAAANAAFSIPEGFFIGPYASGRRSSLGVYPRPTSEMLTKVADTGATGNIDDETRRQAREDLSYWKADCVALAPVRNEAALRTVLEQLLGPGTSIEGVWTWKITR